MTSRQGMGVGGGTVRLNQLVSFICLLIFSLNERDFVPCNDHLTKNLKGFCVC